MSHCTLLRVGLSSSIKTTIRLVLHFFKTLTFLLRSFVTKPWLLQKCLWIEEGGIYVHQGVDANGDT